MSKASAAPFPTWGSRGQRGGGVGGGNFNEGAKCLSGYEFRFLSKISLKIVQFFSVRAFGARELSAVIFGGAARQNTTICERVRLHSFCFH